MAAEGNCLYEPPPSKLLKANILNETWWKGIVLTPTKDRPGLLPPIVLTGIVNHIQLPNTTTTFHICSIEIR